VLRVCLPAFVIGLAALIGFVHAVDPHYRWTFYQSDTVRDFERRNWEAQPDDVAGDAQRATRVLKKGFRGTAYAADLIASWLKRRKDVWVETVPEWLTDEWWAALPLECRGMVTAAELGLSKEDADQLEC